MSEGKLDQVIQQAFKRPNLKLITVEVEGSFNDGGNKTIHVPKDKIVSIEYIEDMLCIEYWHRESTADNPLVSTELIPWNRVRAIYFDDIKMKRVPFPSHL